MTKPNDIVVQAQTLTGKKEYRFVPLKRKDAACVFHNTLLTLVSALADVSGQVSAEDRTAAFLRALKTLDFDTLWALAEKLLRFSILDNEEIKDINETEYFDEKPEELYLAVFHAIVENYPGFFGKIRQALSGFDLSEQMAKLDL
jgi:hypothetical protein